MTREEAARIITVILDCCKGKEEKYEGQGKIPLEKSFKALSMAIEALEQEPTTEICADVISRQDAIDAVIYDGITTLNADERKLLIEQIPSAEPKKGHWIEHEWAEISEGYLISNYECSNCHMWERNDSDFCPNCGADMRGDTE